MKKILLIILTTLLSLNAQALFEIKDASDNTVFEIANDGLRVFNLGDTLMVISSSEIKAYISDSKDKALSRSFSVTTSTTGKEGGTDVLEVGAGDMKVREGSLGISYTDFSPQNIFLGYNSGGEGGMACVYLGNNTGSAAPGGARNVFIGNKAGANAENVISSIFIGEEAGMDAAYGGGMTEYNVAIGQYAGKSLVQGYSNVFIGASAGQNVNGNRNCIVGSEAGRGIVGDTNLILGQQSAYNKTSGEQNVFVGPYTGYSNASGSRNVFLGYQAGYNETTSDKLYIDNSNTTTPLIYGDFSTDKLRINGNMGINYNGVTNYGLIIDVPSAQTSTYTLYVFGDSYSSGGSWLGSDQRFKDNIVTYTGALDKVKLLRGVYFDWNREEFPERRFKAGRQIGVIAQEVEAVVPELVLSDHEGYKAVDYSKFTPILIEAIKEQQQQIDTQQERVNTQQEQINMLINEIETMKNVSKRQIEEE